jgi:hypothetical protein
MRVPIDEVVAAVCRLPVDFEEVGQFSSVELLERSGYLDVRDQVTSKASPNSRTSREVGRRQRRFRSELQVEQLRQ